MKRKMKTKKAVAKRVKLTATGKARYKKTGLRHCLGHKSSKVKRKLRNDAVMFPGDQKRTVDVALPYGI